MFTIGAGYTPCHRQTLQAWKFTETLILLFFHFSKNSRRGWEAEIRPWPWLRPCPTLCYPHSKLVWSFKFRTQIFITEKPQHVKVSFSSVIVLIWRNRLNIIRRSDCRISSPVHRWGGFERTRWRRTMLFGAEYKGFGSGQRWGLDHNNNKRILNYIQNITKTKKMVGIEWLDSKFIHVKCVHYYCLSTWQEACSFRKYSVTIS